MYSIFVFRENYPLKYKVSQLGVTLSTNQIGITKFGPLLFAISKPDLAI